MAHGRFRGTASQPVTTALLMMVALTTAALTCGCGDRSEPQTLVPPVAEQGTSHLRSPQTPSQLPDGNNEPPLSDVSQAVAGVPASGDATPAAATGVVRVVSPDQFREAVARHKGKVVLVDFWATWCVPCRKLFPHTAALSKQFKDQGLVVISVSFDDKAALPEVEAFLKEQSADIEHLMCQFGGGDESFSAYDIGDAGLPYFRIYDRTGALHRAFKNDIEAGKGVEEQEIDAVLVELLK